MQEAPLSVSTAASKSWADCRACPSGAGAVNVVSWASGRNPGATEAAAAAARRTKEIMSHSSSLMQKYAEAECNANRTCSDFIAEAQQY